jgi:hypothetical protein
VAANETFPFSADDKWLLPSINRKYSYTARRGKAEFQVERNREYTQTMNDDRHILPIGH